MAQFNSGTSSTFTPTASTTTLNTWVLTTTTVGQTADVKMISWGGSGTSLVGYVTRWARVSNTPATPTAYLIGSTNPLVTPIATCNTYGTVATGTADNHLFLQSWNVQGGGGAITLPIGGEWRIVGGALGTAFNQVGCGNISGTDANLSTYRITWAE